MRSSVIVPSTARSERVPAGSGSSIATSTVTVPATDDGSVRVTWPFTCRLVVQVDLGGEALDDVLRLILRNAEHGLELAGLHDAGDQRAGVDVLSELERRIAERLELAGFGRRDRHRRDAALLLVENSAQALDLIFLQLDLLAFRALHRPRDASARCRAAALHLGRGVARAGDVVRRDQLSLGERVVAPRRVRIALLYVVRVLATTPCCPRIC